MTALIRRGYFKKGMVAQKRVLIIGLDPAVVDYSKWPGLTPEKINRPIEGAMVQLNGLGYQVELCSIGLGQPVIEKVTEALSTTPYNCVLIGAGIRRDEDQLMLFEQLINVIHEYAPQSKISFNTNPTDTAAAIQRWL